MDKGLRIVGIELILRDHEGKVFAACSLTKNFLVDPTVAEARTALQALEFCRKMGFFDIVIEGDALQIVNEIQAKHGN